MPGRQRIPGRPDPSPPAGRPLVAPIVTPMPDDLPTLFPNRPACEPIPGLLLDGLLLDADRAHACAA